MDRVALAAEQRHGLVERQADDVGIGADDLHKKAPGYALRGVSAGFAAPFAGGEIGFDVLVGEPLEAQPRLDVALTPRLLLRDQTPRGMIAVVAAVQRA